jgi:predicted ATPase/transcriptional regulator with XRE-family HTH domain
VPVHAIRFDVSILRHFRFRHHDGAPPSSHRSRQFGTVLRFISLTSTSSVCPQVSTVTITEPSQLGSLIRRFRLAAGLSQEQLAERSGLSARAVSDLERGLRSHTRPDTLRMLADGLGLNETDRTMLLVAARPGTFSPTAAATTPHVHLPVAPTSLIGRSRETAEIARCFQAGSARLVTLTGPGGVGKTRLALEAARLMAPSEPDGVVFVDLSPVTDPQRVASEISRALGIQESGTRSIRESLRIALCDRRIMLLLDNVEHVIEAAPLIGELLADAPELWVLVTSREALRLRGEQELVIEPLGLPTERDVADLDRLAASASVALFVATARAAKAGFGLSPENASAIAGICRRLDGLPLAIELAAPRLKHLSPAQLLDQLERRLPVLTGGPRDLPARQQTLRATIAWSYDLLSANEQALFRRLSVFAGGAVPAAIDQVVSAAGPLALDLSAGLASLVDKSLLREETGGGDQTRYSMLETIREFALDTLLAAGEGEPVRSAYAAWVLELFETWSIEDPEAFLRLTDLQVLDDEVDNIRAAFDYLSAQGIAESCARLVVGFFAYLYPRGRFREARSLGQSVLVLAENEPIPERIRGRIFGDLAITATMLGEFSEGESLGREGLALLQQSSANVDLLPIALTSLASAIREQGRYSEAMELAEDAYRVATESGHQAWASFSLYHIGKLAYLQNDLDRALTCLADALHQTRLAPPNDTAVYSAVYLAAVHLRRGSLREAARVLSDWDRMVTDIGSGIEGFFLDVVAVLASSTRPLDAVRFFGVEAAYADLTGLKLEEDRWIADVKIALREQLGETAYQAAFQAGRKLGPGDQMALRREILGEFETTP